MVWRINRGSRKHPSTVLINRYRRISRCGGSPWFDYFHLSTTLEYFDDHTGPGIGHSAEVLGASAFENGCDDSPRPLSARIPTDADGAPWREPNAGGGFGGA